VICYRMACTRRDVFAATKPPSPWDERLFCCPKRMFSMGRLKMLAPRLTTLRPRVHVLRRADLEQARDRRRDQEVATRTLYKTARWQRLRLTVLARDLFTCQMCHKVEGNTSLLVCDHIDAHRGCVAKFWAGPFQTLCKDCHDSEKQRTERAAARLCWSHV
jgi:5-methylcytosine-specific restriction enzyme A